MLSITSSLSAPPILPSDSLPAMERDSIADRLDFLTDGKYVLAFSGFSGLGYKDPDALERKISQIIEAAAEQHGAHNLLVVAGATSIGIGAVYAIAQRNSIATLGIVSSQANADDISPDCNEVVYVPDPTGTWKVHDATGNSYMTYVAEQNGTFIALGGGAVTLSELNEAIEYDIPTYICSEFEPNAENAAARLKNKQLDDLTPVKTACQQTLSNPPESTPSGRRRESEAANERWKRSLAAETFSLPHDGTKINNNVKHVGFNESVSVSDTPRHDRKVTDRLNMFDREFRRAVDKEAKKHGLAWAEGHDDPSKHYPFDLGRAQEAAAQ